MDEKKINNLSKLIDLIDLAQGNYVSPQEVVDVVGALVEVIQKLQLDLSSQIDSVSKEHTIEMASCMDELKSIESKLTKIIKEVESDNTSNLEGVEARFRSEISRLDNILTALGETEDFSDRFIEIEETLKVLKAKETTPEEIVGKLESLEGDNRLDISAIKGVGARLSKLADDVVNRAISILDSRTSFLINKVSNLQTLVERAGSGVSTFLGLSDTPNSYAGQSGKVPAVNGTEDGLEFIAVAGSGTVTSVSSADANLTVATGTTTPVLTIVNAPTVTIADAGGDTTTFPLLGTAATGNLAPATDAGLTYNATTNALTTTTFVGALTGNASTATALATPRTIGGTSFDGTANIVPATITVADTTDATSFVALFESATGDLAPKTDAGLTYNASTGTLTATALVGPLTGNVTGDASGNAGTVTVANEATDTTCFPLFATAASGSLAPKTNTNLTFNSNTGVLTSASAVLTTADINGGTVDGAVIGGASAAAVTGTTITANTGFMPDANDGAYLGQSGTAFADLFLASGGIINWAAGNATLTHSSGLLTSNVPVSLGTSNAFTCGTIELGAASDTTVSRSAAGVIAVEGVVIPSISSTNTLTNKRITKRVGTTTSSATPTINTDNVDYYSLTAQAADITSFTTNLSGTPTDNQTLWISITGTAARAITWGSSFEASTVALPTTTVSTDRLDVGFVWNSASSKWRCVAKC